MKRFNSIVMQDEEPVGKNVLWIKDGVMYHYEGGWKPILKAFSSSSDKVKSID